MLRADSSSKDSELVARLRRRDAHAVGVLYDRYGKLGYTIIFRAVNNAAVAEDLTQEMFLRVWNRILAFNEQRESFKAWLTDIARNHALDYLRSVGREGQDATHQGDDLGQPLVNPPSRLRRRIVSGFGIDPAGEKVWNWQWAYWALAGATILALTIGLNVQNRAWRMQHQGARAADVALAQMRQAVAILQAPGTQRIPFGGASDKAPRGTLYVHPRLGIALVADQLANAPRGWTYESWVAPINGLPQPVQAFAPSADEQAVTVIPGPVPAGKWKAIVVSMESENSQMARPDKVVFSVPLGG